jgi:hypothetical protein
MGYILRSASIGFFVIQPLKDDELGRRGEVKRVPASMRKPLTLEDPKWADEFKEGKHYDVLRGQDLEDFKQAGPQWGEPALPS